MIKSLTIINGKAIEEGFIIDVEIGLPNIQATNPDGSAVKFTNLEENVEPVTVRALIDIGSSNSCIADRIADEFQLITFGTQEASNALEFQHTSRICFAKIILPTEPLEFEANGQVQTLPFINTDFDCVIGRSILSHCNSTYYGKENKYVLEFETP